ncbi:SMI1/KNR4 family protein [bacterium]|nr:MAG: SMI1/KNR4 family protein [bacterium]
MNRYDELAKQIAWFKIDGDTGERIMQFMNSDEEGNPPKSLGEEELQEVEAQLGHSLPEDYREFLRSYGGLLIPNSLPLRTPTAEGFPMGLTSAFFAATSDKNFDLLEHNDPLGYLPFELIQVVMGDNGLYCLSIAGEHKGEVYFWDAPAGDEEEHFQLVASSFDKFLQRLSTPIDENNPFGV